MSHHSPGSHHPPGAAQVLSNVSFNPHTNPVCWGYHTCLTDGETEALRKRTRFLGSTNICFSTRLHWTPNQCLPPDAGNRLV